MNASFGHNASFETLDLGSGNVIRPWGVETSDGRGFFSLTAPGWNYDRTIEQHATSKSNRLSIRAKSPESAWTAQLSEQVSGDRIERSLSLVTDAPSRFNDLVLRYRIEARFVRTVRIGGESLVYSGSNRYHQHRVDGLELLLSDGRTLSFSSQLVEGSDLFDVSWYARDVHDEWIIHCRLLPKPDAPLELKITTRLMTRTLPHWVAAPVLAVPTWRKQLSYLAERTGRMWPFNAYRIAQVPKDARIELSNQVFL